MAETAIKWIAGVIIGAIWFGCSDDGNSNQTLRAGSGGSFSASEGASSGKGTESSAIVGAWYGAGPEFPDGDQCFLFCSNGRFFAGDRSCTDITAGDFDQYLEYTYENGVMEAQSPKGVQLSASIVLAGDLATFTIPGPSGETFVLTMNRTAEDSPLCEDPEAIWSGW